MDLQKITKLFNIVLSSEVLVFLITTTQGGHVKAAENCWFEIFESMYVYFPQYLIDFW